MVSPRIIVANGIDLSIAIAGFGGKSIVFLHGGSMSKNTWMPQLTNKELLMQFRLIAVDLPGHGSSQHLGRKEAYKLDFLAETIRVLLDLLELERFILVGLSYGTTLIGEMKLPGNGCKGMMLVSPFVVNNKYNPAAILKPNPFSYVAITENPTEPELRGFINAGTANSDVGERFYESYRNTDPAFRPSIAETFTGGYTDQLFNIQQWKVPVCVVFGSRENSVRTDYLDDYTPLWNGKVYRIKNSVHVPNEEDPGSFNRLLLEFASEIFK